MHSLLFFIPLKKYSFITPRKIPRRFMRMALAEFVARQQNNSCMDARRGWGFAQPQEKGLFTFYREQKEHSERAPSNQRDGPSFRKQQKLPTRLNPQRYKTVLSPSASLPLHEKVQHRATPTPSPTNKQHRMRKLLLPLSPTPHKPLKFSTSPRSIVDLTFEHSPTQEHTTPRRLNRHRHLRGKTKTQGSPSSPSALPYSTPLKQTANKNNDPKQEQLFDCFTEKYEPPFKMKALAARLSSSKRVMKKQQEEPKQEISSERDQWSSLKPIAKGVPILPISGGSNTSGMSISFWDYFQQRKKLLLGRYKRERAGIIRPPPRRPKAALTNNHI